jgi:hypothetical protein
MLDAFQHARLLLPNMPEEILQLWLDERIKTSGWRPAGIEWRGFLRSLPFEVWQRLEWPKADVDLRLSDFTSGAQQIFEGLASANFFSTHKTSSACILEILSRVFSR